MAFSLYEPAKCEDEVSAALRSICVDLIARRDLSESAQLLGLAQFGLEKLLWEPVWDLRVAFRVAEALEAGVLSTLSQVVQRRVDQDAA